jgi:hypothetical protein
MCPQADIDGLANLGDVLTLPVLDDVIRCCEDTDETCDLDLNPGFFIALSDCALCCGLAGLQPASWDGPQSVIGSLEQENVSGFVADQRAS